MKSERIINALGRADNKYVEEAMYARPAKNADFEAEAVQAEPVVTAAGTKRRSFGGWAAAACLCAAVGGLTLWGMIGSSALINGGSDQDVDLTDGSTDGMMGITGVTHTFLSLSREELYGCEWTMFIPRRLPENYRLEEDTMFVPSGFMNEGTIYIRLTDGSNPISYTVYADRSKYEELSGTELLIRELSLEDMPLLKENGWIDCGNAVVMIKVEIEKPDLIPDEELYRFIMSAPFADNFAASGIETIDLSAMIGTHLPTVATDEFFDVQRLTISGELMAEHGGICYFDGKYIYFDDSEYDFSLDENGQFSYGNCILTRYDIETGEQAQWSMGNRNYNHFICSDDKYIYCEAFLPTENVSLTGENSVKYDYGTVCLTRIDIATGEETVIVSVEGNCIPEEPVVNDGVIYTAIDLHNVKEYLELYDTEKFDGYKIICYDTKSGAVTILDGTDRNISAVPDRWLCDTVDHMMPYKDGVLFQMSVREGEYYYWDGSEGSEAELFLELETVYNDDGTITHAPELRSDGEILYYAETGIVHHFGNNYNEAYSEEKQAFYVLDVNGNSVTVDPVLAENNAASDEKDIYSWIKREAGKYNADGMILLNSSSGVIYDAVNGVFTCPDPDMYYEFFGTVGKSLILMESDSPVKSAPDEGHEETEEDVTLCIITRK